MPYIAEHAPKVSTRSVYPYARETLRKRIQQDRHTNTHTHRRVVQNHLSRRFEGCTFQTRSYLKHDLLYFLIYVDLTSRTPLSGKVFFFEVE